MLYLIETIRLEIKKDYYIWETCYVISTEPPFDGSISTLMLTNILESYLRKYATLHNLQLEGE